MAMARFIWRPPSMFIALLQDLEMSCVLYFKNKLMIRDFTDMITAMLISTFHR